AGTRRRSPADRMCTDYVYSVTQMAYRLTPVSPAASSKVRPRSVPEPLRSGLSGEHTTRMTMVGPFGSGSRLGKQAKPPTIKPLGFRSTGIVKQLHGMPEGIGTLTDLSRSNV